MCVIAIASRVRPTPTMVEDMFAANGDGAGVAWRQDGKVFWEKGLELDRVKELVATLPMPFVAHFRIASIGGVRPSLCHPFPVSSQVPLALKGNTTGAVLFHNGHWNDWKKEMQEVVLHSGRRYEIPTGKWSDSRAIAFLTYVYGPGILDMIGEKTVAFGPNMSEVAGTGWTEVDGVAVSNNYFRGRSTTVGYYGGRGQQYLPTMCKEKRCTRKDIDVKTGYCPDHGKDGTEVKAESGEVAQHERPFEKGLRLLSEGKLTELDNMVKNQELSKKQKKRVLREWEYRLRSGKAIPRVTTH